MLWYPVRFVALASIACVLVRSARRGENDGQESENAAPSAATETAVVLEQKADSTTTPTDAGGEVGSAQASKSTSDSKNEKVFAFVLEGGTMLSGKCYEFVYHPQEIPPVKSYQMMEEARSGKSCETSTQDAQYDAGEIRLKNVKKGFDLTVAYDHLEKNSYGLQVQQIPHRGTGMRAATAYVRGSCDCTEACFETSSH
eukprot:TRINITY_DN45566_c0_g1_i2.p1 TRINITY_DN45566_c0_g1~~TRINITY_DN45566_c0_g1_i2.p1  ORF type:complete len:199 (+),score=22.67 TRINITY_DN45566_c0_g1_i2:58-654(+)